MKNLIFGLVVVAVVGCSKSSDNNLSPARNITYSQVVDSLGIRLGAKYILQGIPTDTVVFKADSIQETYNNTTVAAKIGGTKWVGYTNFSYIGIYTLRNLAYTPPPLISELNDTLVFNSYSPAKISLSAFGRSGGSFVLIPVN